MDLINDWLGDLTAVGIVIIAVLVGLVVHWIGYRVAMRLARETESNLDESLIQHTRNPIRLLVVVGAVFLSMVFMEQEAREFVRQADLFVAVIGLGWLLVGLTLVGQDAVVRRFPTDVENDAEARSIETQLTVLQRFGSIIIWLLTVAIALLTIPGVQALAASLLAGAGVMGIVLGVAAGPLIGNLIAGVQIAFTQPIKIGDVVVIEGEWGHIGEITAAYVVVYIWDKRRLIVPLSKIVNEPLETWTRTGNELLGTVKIYTDYRAPIEEIRTEFKRILDESGLWDGEAWSILVTGASEQTMTVRAMYSAPDSSVEWTLRCLVREKLIGFLQERYPESLPTRRYIDQGVGTPEEAAS
jgi:small-conductance mechanosensitive channel